MRDNLVEIECFHLCLLVFKWPTWMYILFEFCIWHRDAECALRHMGSYSLKMMRPRFGCLLWVLISSHYIYWNIIWKQTSESANLNLMLLMSKIMSFLNWNILFGQGWEKIKWYVFFPVRNCCFHIMLWVGWDHRWAYSSFHASRFFFLITFILTLKMLCFHLWVKLNRSINDLKWFLC